LRNGLAAREIGGLKALESEQNDANTRLIEQLKPSSRLARRY
jgi:hypothetical protein